MREEAIEWGDDRPSDASEYRQWACSPCPAVIVPKDAPAELAAQLTHVSVKRKDDGTGSSDPRWRETWIAGGRPSA